MWFFGLFQRNQKNNKNSERKQLNEAETANPTVANEQHGNTTGNNVQTKIFLLYRAKDDKELTFLQEALSDLINQECGHSVYPYCYDEDILGDFSNFDSENIYYFFSLNGFELELIFCLENKIIMLKSKGRADDPLGNAFADRLKQHIHKVLTQKVVLEEVKNAFESKTEDCSKETENKGHIVEQLQENRKICCDMMADSQELKNQRNEDLASIPFQSGDDLDESLKENNAGHPVCKTIVTKGETNFKTEAPSVEKNNCSEPIAILDIKGEFGGTIVKVLKENYQVSGFEKSFEKKSILRKGSQCYYQTIEKVVVSENNARPNTYYNEYVYQMNASNIDAISLENIGEYIVSDCVFDKCTAEPGVLF